MAHKKHSLYTYHVPATVLLLVFFNVYLVFTEKERERKSRGRAARKRIQSGLCTDNRAPDVGLELTNCEIVT